MFKHANRSLVGLITLGGAIITDLADWEEVRVLGRGSFGEVTLCRDQTTIEEIAAKFIEGDIQVHQSFHFQIVERIFTKTKYAQPL